MKTYRFISSSINLLFLNSYEDIKCDTCGKFPNQSKTYIQVLTIVQCKIRNAQFGRVLVVGLAPVSILSGVIPTSKAPKLLFFGILWRIFRELLAYLRSAKQQHLNRTDVRRVYDRILTMFLRSTSIASASGPFYLNAKTCVCAMPICKYNIYTLICISEE